MHLLKKMLLIWCIAGLSGLARANADDAKSLRAGAAAVDVSPVKFPVIVNGGFLQAMGTQNLDRLYARTIVLEDGSTKLSITVVDSCMMPRDLIDKAKQIAHQKTGIPVDRMLVSATHTHTAPSAMGALGTPPDPDYVAFLPAKIAESIEKANANLNAARIGWAVVDDYDHTHTRRWIRRPDKMINDPFGNTNVRAHMHPGYQNPDTIGPSGPVDPGLSVLSIQTRDGKPLAILANYSMHYFGTKAVSADYYGKFCNQIAKLVGATENSGFVGIMSQGTSGDQHWMDYSQPKSDMTIDRFATEVADRAFQAYQKIHYRDDISLAMAQKLLSLNRRTPDADRLKWARETRAKMARPVPANIPEVYACEAIEIDSSPVRELKLQAIRIGEVGITAIPNEVYAISGLKLKHTSPLPTTFNIELANGSEGYIPPPEQHALGGYTTWPARTAGLEVGAEPQIVDTLLSLLEQVSGRPRKAMPANNASHAILVKSMQPSAYWQLDEISGTKAHDRSGHGHDAIYEKGVALFLEGSEAPGMQSAGLGSRSPHLAGGRIVADLKSQSTNHKTVSFWFWNGLPENTRSITGILASLNDSELIGLTGSASPTPGRIFVSLPGTPEKVLSGKTPVKLKSWNHLVFCRDGATVRIYLNGQDELSGEIQPGSANGQILMGGDSSSTANFEGKLDEFALFDRTLTAAEVAQLYSSALKEQP